MGDESDSGNAYTNWELALRTVLAHLPEEYAARSTTLAEISHRFRSHLADALEPALNATVSSRPYGTLDEKRATAYWVNHELHQFGLAIRCPETGLPAILVADFNSAKPSAGRFRLEVHDETGKMRRPVSSHTPFTFQLMEDIPRIEGSSRWASRRKHHGPKSPEK
jgi:hypothetical protein